MPVVISSTVVATAILGLTADKRQHRRQWRLVAIDNGTAGPVLEDELPAPVPITGEMGIAAVNSLAEAAFHHLRSAARTRLRSLPQLTAADLVDRGDALVRAFSGMASGAQMGIRQAMRAAGLSEATAQRVVVAWVECGLLVPSGPVDGWMDRTSGPSPYQVLSHWLWPIIALSGAKTLPGLAITEDGSALAGDLVWTGEAAPLLMLAEDGLADRVAALKQAHRLVAEMEAMRTDPRWAVAGETLWPCGVTNAAIEQIALASGRLVLHAPARFDKGLPRYGRALQWQAANSSPADEGPAVAAYRFAMDAAADELALQTGAEAQRLDYAKAAMEWVVRQCAEVYKLAVQRTVGRLSPEVQRDPPTVTEALQTRMENVCERLAVATEFLTLAAHRVGRRRPELIAWERVASRRIVVANNLLKMQADFTDDQCMSAGTFLSAEWGVIRFLKQGVPFNNGAVLGTPFSFTVDVQPLKTAYFEKKGVHINHVPDADQQRTSGVLVLCELLKVTYLDYDVSDVVQAIEKIVERPFGVGATWIAHRNQVVDPAQPFERSVGTISAGNLAADLGALEHGNLTNIDKLIGHGGLGLGVGGHVGGFG